MNLLSSTRTASVFSDFLSNTSMFVSRFAPEW